MAGTLGAPPSTGKVFMIWRRRIRRIPLHCTLRWSIPDFMSLMKRDKMYFSPAVPFNGAVWRMCLDVELIHLNLCIVREPTTPPMILEVTVGFGILNELRKDRVRCTEYVVRDGREAYISFNCLQKTELLKKMSDLLPSNILTVICTLKVQKDTENPVRKHDNASGCGLIWTIGYVNYICRTCATSPNVTFCPDCFKKGNHEGHDFNMDHSLAGGYCNCGDKAVMKESGFCRRHDPGSQIDESESPPDVLFVAEVLMPRFFSKLNQHLLDNYESGKSCASLSSNILQEYKVLNDFKEFFLKKENCDVVIKVQGKEFPAHRAILEARSPVLASTFRNDMKEKATGVMEIEDCDPSSFSDFLCFLYCGDVEIISQANVFSLFTAADKYDVQDLRAQCTKFMKKNLCVDTFCDTITLALRHSETELIKLTTDFFTKNAAKIVLTATWQSFLAENPTESNELLVKLLVPNNSNLSE